MNGAAQAAEYVEGPACDLEAGGHHHKLEGISISIRNTVSGYLSLLNQTITGETADTLT